MSRKNKGKMPVKACRREGTKGGNSGGRALCWKKDFFSALGKVWHFWGGRVLLHRVFRKGPGGTCETHGVN